jgi:hypothetical protein
MAIMEMDDRLTDLERRVAALEGGERPVPAVDGDPFFLLRALKERIEEPGAVAYVGAVTLPDGQTAEWQFGRPADAVLEVEWAGRASALAALGNPVRLTLLQEIVRGRTTVAALGEIEGVGTSGQIYHHLRQLAAEGWLHSPSRGVFAVPVARVVPLLAILVALEK